MKIKNFASAALFGATFFAAAANSFAGEADSTLRQLAEARGRFVGAILNSEWFSYGLGNDASLYEETHKSQFNIVVAENEMKFDATEPKRNSFNFKKGDKLVAYAKEANMQVRGHALAWHSQVPQWVPDLAESVEKAGGSAKDTLLAVLKNHIENVVGHYKGAIREWDVVNEAIDGNPAEWRPGTGQNASVWYKYIGREFIDSAFVWAHAADPDAKLYYNDYSLEWGLGAGTKAQFAVDSVAKRLKDAGIYITGIGTQTHIANYHETTPQNVRALAKALQEIGLTLQITELDIGYDNGKIVTDADRAAQGHLYRQFMDVFLEEANMEAFVIWGFCDKYSWLKDQYKFDGLIFDSSFAAKPAYDSLVASLKAHDASTVTAASEARPIVWEPEETGFGKQTFVIVDYSEEGAENRGSWESDVKAGEPKFVNEKLDNVTGYMNIPLAGCDQNQESCGYQHAIYKLPSDAVEAKVLSKCEALVLTMYGPNGSIYINTGFNEPWGGLEYGVRVGDRAWVETTVDLQAVRDSAANPAELTFNSESAGFYLAKIEAKGCPDPDATDKTDSSDKTDADSTGNASQGSADSTIAIRTIAQSEDLAITVKKRKLHVIGAKDAKIDIFDLQGKPIVRKQSENGTLDLSRLANGIYIARTSAYGRIVTNKIEIK